MITPESISESVNGSVERIKSIGRRDVEGLLMAGVVEAKVTAWYIGSNKDSEFKATDDGRIVFIGTAKASFHDPADADKAEATLRRIHSEDSRVTVYRLNRESVDITVSITV